ncbi:MAG: lysophospholipid acyltransferase family protein [Rubrivivax sp.]
MTFVLRWLARRSLRLLHALGALLGWLVWAAAPGYRRRLTANAAAAGVSAAQRRAAVAEAGRMSLEMPRLWLRPPGEPIADPVRWSGAEHVERALDAGRGLVFLTPHMGSFELCAQAYAERFGARQPVTVLYRPSRNAWLRRLEETARARPHLFTAPATLAGVRQLLRALRRGQTVGLLPDQVPPEGMGVWAPFFGRDAYTMTLAARLVRQSGAALYAIWGERLARGAGYHVHVLPMPVPLVDAAALPADEAAAQRLDASAINRSMEALIAQCPSQYLWGYHRYKSPRRPEAA